MKSEKVIKRIKEFLKVYWKRVLLICGLILSPFVIEIVLFNTPVISKFDNSTWFSFMGSYMGALITVAVMYITFQKSDKESRKMAEAQIEWIEFQNRNEKIVEIMKVLLLEDYFFLSKDSVCENIDKFVLHLRKIQWDTLILNCIEEEGKELMTALLELQKEEREILDLNGLIHVNSSKKADEFKELLMHKGMELRNLAEGKRDSIQGLYAKYYKRMHQKYYIKLLDNK